MGFVADVLDGIGTIVGVVPSTRPPSDYGPSDVDHLTEEEMRSLPKRPTLSEELGVELGDNNILRLTDGTVDKIVFDGPEPSEATTLDMVFRNTTIPVPRVRRVIGTGEDVSIIMDYIKGRQLGHVWPTMSFFEKLRVGFILRRYIRQLRTIRHSRAVVPGPAAPGFEARVCQSHIFGTRQPQRGPFASYAELAAFWNERNRSSMEIETTYWNVPPEEAQACHKEPFDDSHPLVLTHGDLNMRNVLVGDDGRLWLIDWGASGFYPIWFEFTIMTYQAKVIGAPIEDDVFWMRLMPFICGPYYHQARWHSRASSSLNFL
ncbi:hypothetical protein TRAPUB_9579 [Trametes pubescens]|uniref:Aminoglycoside phosphotransferase domain-containing protein n=1 Tax=Trametes pubescens TaxID=154538 RepID=A0A1M2W1X0_TRAPU|nr:hypothetical protein TRAPUB_9579 [Trametes pubescens]